MEELFLRSPVRFIAIKGNFFKSRVEKTYFSRRLLSKRLYNASTYDKILPFLCERLSKVL